MRPIDLDKALLAVCSGCNEEFLEEPCEPGCCRIREKLENAPTLTLDDLRPKGRWEEIEETSSGWKQHRCSVCKAEAIFEYTYTDDYDEGIDGEWEYIGQREDGIIERLTDFCPSCGADMRGGDTR